MEQERKDDAHGKPTTPTPSAPTRTTNREGGQHPADPNNLGSPSNRSRGQAPGAHSPGPTHTVCSAHRGATTQWDTDHYPSTTDTTGPPGGRATGERKAQRQLVDPEPDNAPQTQPKAPHHASVPRARTAQSIAPKNQTTVTYCGATRTTSTAPAKGAEDEHQTHTPKAPPTRCTAHNGINPEPPMQRRNGTPTTAPGRPTQAGPTEGG